MKRPSKKILYVTYHLPLSNEPGAFRPWMEAKLMRDAGLDVHIITGQRNYLTCDKVVEKSGLFVNEEVDGIPVTRIWMPPNFRKSLFRRAICYTIFSALAFIVLLFKTLKFDYIFCCTDPITILPVCSFSAFVFRRKLVIDERDLFPETAIALGVVSEGLLTQTIQCYINFVRRKSHAILCATPGIENYMRQKYPNKTIILLYNADVYLNSHIPSIKAETKQSAPKQFKPYAIYAGGMGYANDIMTLLEAAKLLSKNTVVRIKIIGSGENFQKYADFIRQNQLTNVELCGSVPRSEVVSIISNALFGIQPLRSDKHFEMTLTSKTFDYMGHGVPILFSGRGDGEDILEISGAGISVPPENPSAMADAMEKLFASPDKISTMKRNGKKWYGDNITVENGIDKFKELFS